MRYAMAQQTCLLCGTSVPFIPFTDPVCDDCSKPIDLVIDELPTVEQQAQLIRQLTPPIAVYCSKEA